VSPTLSFKNSTRVEVSDSNKRSSLIRHGIEQHLLDTYEG